MILLRVSRFLILPLLVLSLSIPAYSVIHAQSAGDTAGAAAGVATCLGAGATTAGPASSLGGVVAVPTNSQVANLFAGGELAKECALDALTVLLRETLIRKITSSIVTWINSGFEGSPAFVTNIDQFLLDTADETFGNFIYNDANFAHLCAPFQYDIRFALALNYSTSQYRPTCTLSQIVDNVETAIDDLSVEWDWDVYETIATDPQGNVFSSFLAEQERVDDLVGYEIQASLDDVNRGNGFLSFEKCENEAESTNFYGVGVAGASNSAREDVSCEVVTPGVVIAGTLQETIGLDLKGVKYADELNEIIGALMGQLAGQAIGIGGGGLRGLQERQGETNNFLQQYQQDSSNATQQFGSGLASGVSQNSQQQISAYVATQNQNLARLFAAEPQVSETLACYESKFNTWLTLDGDVIPATEVESVPEDERVRAWFTGVNVNGEFNRGSLSLDVLTSQEAGDKVTEYRALLARINNDVSQVQAGIAQARVAADRSAAIEAQLSSETNPRDLQAIYSNFGTTNGASITPDVALATQQSIDTYLDAGINGSFTFNGSATERSGGAIADLQACRAFNDIIEPGSVTVEVN